MIPFSGSARPGSKYKQPVKTMDILEPSYYRVIENVRTSHQYIDKIKHFPTKYGGRNLR